MIDELEFSAAPAVAKPGGFGEDGAVDETSMLARWERLRIVYNAILTAEVLVISLPMFSLTWAKRGFLIEMVLGAIGANLCYCAGPVLNAYFHWAGVRGRAVTIVLFVVGSSVAMFLTLIYVMLLAYPLGAAFM